MAVKKSNKKPVKKLAKKKVVSRKKVVAKNLAKKFLGKAPGKPIGKVTHYFSNIKVAIVKLSAPLSQGDQINIVGGQDTDFKQLVASIQIDHKPVKRAPKGKSIGLKTKQIAREGYQVYKI